MQQQQSSDDYARSRRTADARPSDPSPRARAEEMLRDIAFVLNATARVKEAMADEART